MEDKATRQEMFLIGASTAFFLSVCFSLLFGGIELFFKITIYEMKWYWITTILIGALWLISGVIFYGKLFTLMMIHWVKGKELEKRLLIHHQKQQLKDIKNGKAPVLPKGVSKKESPIISSNTQLYEKKDPVM